MVQGFASMITLFKGIFASAKSGQTLPLCTMVLCLHFPLHLGLLVLADKSLQNTFSSAFKISLFFLIFNIVVNISGYVLLIMLYKHSVKTIFNKEVPQTLQEVIPSFCVHLSLLRPIEIMFRYCTHRWRVLPDVIVLGEVRCGTTSLCHHLALLKDHYIECRTPFCLWAHPELDHKETFFFVGHYLGIVTPSHYRMCFPLKITKWWIDMKWKVQNQMPWRKSMLSKPFMTFDGCAQYLTSPSAPYLIAEAYRAANQPPPILIACVREPQDQAMSWWKYENNSLVWGEGMGLTEHNTALRGEKYPPTNINDALASSRGDEVSNLYKRAESLFSSDSLSRSNVLKENSSLPGWAMSWPGGQFSGIGRNALFTENISRYERVFQKVFSQDGTSQNGKELQFVKIAHLSMQKDRDSLKRFLVEMLQTVGAKRKNGLEKEVFARAVDHFRYSKNTIVSVHRNATANTKPKEGNLLSKESIEYFDDQNEKLLSLCKRNGVS